jgi:hypothetical protein
MSLNGNTASRGKDSVHCGWVSDVRLLSGYLDVIDRETGLRDGFTVSFETFNVKFDSFHDKFAYFRFTVPDDSTSWYIRRICTIAGRSLLDDDGVSFGAYFKPACFRITFRVPAGTSLLPVPATHRTGLRRVNELHMTDLLTIFDPSRRKRSSTSRYFIGMVCSILSLNWWYGPRAGLGGVYRTGLPQMG